jgi:hypothetical protein
MDDFLQLAYVTVGLVVLMVIAIVGARLKGPRRPRRLRRHARQQRLPEDA